MINSFQTIFFSGLEQELCIFTQEHCAEVYQPGRCHYCVGSAQTKIPFSLLKAQQMSLLFIVPSCAVTKMTWQCVERDVKICCTITKTMYLFRQKSMKKHFDWPGTW